MSRTLDIRIPHDLGRAKARERIDSGLTKALQTDAAARFAQTQHRWEGDRLHFELDSLGQKVTGTADVADDAVTLHITLPWLLAALAEKIRPQIEQQARRVLTDQR